MASESSSSGPDPTLYLFTSLTAGSSHIITATSRLETILKANKVAFRALDCATDEKARQLWARRSKGRKLPGLVKYGQVIGDLMEVEEWNEYGELKDQVDGVSDLFGDTPMTDNPMPPPAPITTKDPLNKIVEPPPRLSSESRHISISDPKDFKEAMGTASSVKSLKDDTPMAIAMRQASAEAAAKAGQRKASATAAAIPAKRDSSEVTPSPAATKLSVDAEEPADATEVTAAKVPAVLAAEGAKRTSVDKINDQEVDDSLKPPTAEVDAKSTEEQLLEIRRTSSVTKQPSRLAQETSIDDVETSVPEVAASSDANLPATDSVPSESKPRQHRGSSLGEATEAQIKEVEQKTAIKEESDEDSDEESSEEEAVKPGKQTATKTTVQASDKAEEAVMQGTKPQDQKPGDGNAAGFSALFLRPDVDPKRLSADSASVYSFFDSSFSPAPLFSETRPDLDLNLNFKLSDLTVYASTDDSKPAVNGHDDGDSSVSDTEHRHDNREDPMHDIQEVEEPEDVPMPTPLRTPARRLHSEPLLSRTATPTSSTRMSSFDAAAAPLSASASTVDASPFTTPASPSSPMSPSSAGGPGHTPSRSLRFKKSLRSLRSKTSLQRLRAQQSPGSPGSSSPLAETPPALPALSQAQLKGVAAQVSVSPGSAPGSVRKKSSMRNLLCF